MKQAHYRINLPHVVHDTIEGETILVNLKNGNYYSFDKFGVLIWDLVILGIRTETLLGMIRERFKLDQASAESLFFPFVQDLLKEELIVREDQEPVTGEEALGEARAQLDLFGLELAKPILHRYENLQDMLFLDPIHDTDEKGWPSGVIVHHTRDWQYDGGQIK